MHEIGQMFPRQVRWGTSTEMGKNIAGSLCGKLCVILVIPIQQRNKWLWKIIES